VPAESFTLYPLSLRSADSGDVYCQYPDRCSSLSFFLTYFLSFYLSRFSFYVNSYLFLHPEVIIANMILNDCFSLQDVLKFSLKHLEPESLYFLQVQALSQFGRERLKGEKAAIFLNTADHKNGKFIVDN